MNKNHAIQYPAMSHGVVSLRMATSSGELATLNAEFANDLEARANLTSTYFSFQTVKEDTWAGEYWLIQYKGESVGYIGINFERSKNICGLAIAVLKPYRDTGIGIKAVAMILRYMFDVLGVRKLETECFGYNLRSQKIYASFLTPEGIQRESAYWAGRYWDRHLFGLTSQEWQQRRAKIDRLLRVEMPKT